jgi:hypothetical protein
VKQSFRTRKILDENPQLRDQWTSLIPVGKMGTPEDLMGLATISSRDLLTQMDVVILVGGTHKAVSI